ncbi:hypothetical protein GGQ88_002275 [Novosphingobium hassiacum]|uniref:Lipoprotein n=1 Tax=Novosphingobium hassiacum TaxID=173676 RepID=A0A7W6EW63_9SPHN|nr:hypothetical protein [Novosphingobium hassiacum]MBB3861003.1 hypothetical protein [Novosphingobium hassiacum]
MRFAVVLIGVALLAGCKDSEQTDEQAIAAVNAAQDVRPPVQPITPQVILYPDITTNKLHGTGCAFVADGGGMGAVLLAQGDRAYIKLADKIVALASDAGSANMPLGSWSRYTGKEYALVVKADGPVPASDAARFDGGLVITDAFERPVYQARGSFQCRAI